MRKLFRVTCSNRELQDVINSMLQQLELCLGPNDITPGKNMRHFSDSKGGVVLEAITGGGTGNATVAKIAPVTLTKTKPKQIPSPAVSVTSNKNRFFINLGFCQGKLADNWKSAFDCLKGGDSTKTYFWAKLYFAPGAVPIISKWEVVSSSEEDGFVNPAWPAGGDRPANYYHPLGRVNGDGTFLNTGGGSLIVTEHVVTLANSGRPGVGAHTKQILVQREGY